MRPKLGSRCGAEHDAVVINSMLGAAASRPGHGTTEEKRLLEVWRRMPDLYFAPEPRDA
jgi:hypothetical protein